MLNTDQLLGKAKSEKRRHNTEPLISGTGTGLFKLLSSIIPEEQRGLGSGDNLQNQSCQLQRSQSAGQTTKKEHKPRRRHKKGRSSAEAEDLFSPPSRKPSFPFQWAWESFIIDGQTLLQPSASLSPGQRCLLLPTAPHLKSRRKSTAHLSEDLVVGHKMEAQRLGKKHQLGACGTIALPLGKAESLGLESASQGSNCLTGKGSWSEFEDGSEAEGQEAEEGDRDLSLGELPQLPGHNLLLEEWVSEVMEEEEHSALNKRNGSSGSKHSNSGEKASGAGELEGYRQGHSSSYRKPHKGMARAKELKGPWDLDRLHRQLQEELDCGPQKPTWKVLRAAVQASARNKKSSTLGDAESLFYASFSNRTFHKRQEATRRKERQRFVEYQAELQGIQHRVQARPFLFQQAMQTNARLTANRRFSQVLSALGVDEEQLLAEAGKAEGTPRRQRSHRSLGAEMEPSSLSPPKTEGSSSQPERQLSPTLDPQDGP
ncbi:testis-specific protein 10-interacting protein isoform X4 [Meriones unguiculatus]|uniref:testis-specific protein 10-interacting protein isoform X4 n=1 Tax=Meriones unguiculatus TaxID=10047 RepID=UPI00293F51A9|nr:testis-specific protein 10-interacting protein isoform X4 [Meriones unguiculatus]